MGDSALARRIGTAALPRGHELLARPSWRTGFAGWKAVQTEAMMACALSGLLYFLCHMRGLSLLQLDSSLRKLAAEQLPLFFTSLFREHAFSRPRCVYTSHCGVRWCFPLEEFSPLFS